MPIVYDWTHVVPWNNDDKEWSKQFRHQLFGADLDSTNRNPRFKYPITIQAVATNTTTLFTIDEDYEAVALTIDTEALTSNGVDISPAVMTAGNALDIGDADSLTTGGIANFVSNSADTSTRTLHQITNDNAAATGATVLGLKQDSTGNIQFLHSTAAGATGVTVEAHHDSASPAISDVAFRLSMRAEDDNSSKVESARMDVVLDAVTSGSDSAHVNFVVRSAGSAVTPFSIYGDGIRLANTVANSMILATNTVATATGVIWEGHHNSATPAGSDVAFRLSMNGEDDNSSKIEYAKIETVIDTVTSGSTGGHVAITCVSAGSAVNILNVHGDRIALASSATTQMVDSVNTNAGATGVIWSTHHNSASPAISDVAFRLSMNAEDDNSSIVQSARMDVVLDAVTSGTDSAHVNFVVRSAGSAVTPFSIYGDGIRLSNTLANAMIQATNTVATATGVIWEGHHNSASPAGSDIAFRLSMNAEDDNSSKVEYAKIEAVLDTVTSGSTGGHVAVSVVSAGTAVNLLNIHGDRIEMNSAATTQMIDSVNTNAGATGVIWATHHNSASPAISDVVFRLAMSGENADSTKVEYGRIDTSILAVDSTGQASRMSFYVQSGATSVESMRIQYGKIVTNEISNISVDTTDVYDRLNDLELLSLYGAEPEKRKMFYETYAKEGIATPDKDGEYWIDDKQEKKLFRGAFKQTWTMLQELRAELDAAKAMIQAQA